MNEGDSKPKDGSGHPHLPPSTGPGQHCLVMFVVHKVDCYHADTKLIDFYSSQASSAFEVKFLETLTVLKKVLPELRVFAGLCGCIALQ